MPLCRKLSRSIHSRTLIRNRLLLSKYFSRGSVRSNVTHHFFNSYGVSQTRMFNDKFGSVQFPISSCENWFYRTTVPQCSLAVATITLTPSTFSLDSVFLDSEEFQSASSAQLLRESEQKYDWDKIRALLAQDKGS